MRESGRERKREGEKGRERERKGEGEKERRRELEIGASDWNLRLELDIRNLIRELDIGT